MSNTKSQPAIPEAAIEAALDARRAVIANNHDRMKVALLAALPHLAMRAVSASTIYRHKKRGTEYVLIGYGRMQTKDWNEWDVEHDGENNRVNTILGPSVDMREVAIYRSVTDPTEIWVRPREEFEDGRFEVLK